MEAKDIVMSKEEHCINQHNNACAGCHHIYEADWRHGGGFADGDFFTDCGYPREGKTVCKLKGKFYIDAAEDCPICIAGFEHTGDKEFDLKVFNLLKQFEETSFKAGAKEEGERITTILEKEYPAITTWQCWQVLKKGD